MEAVRAAREAALERARRQTVQARIGFAIGAAAVALAAFAFAPRLARRRHAPVQAAVAARPAPPVAAPAPEPIGPAPAAPAIAAATPASPATAAATVDAPAGVSDKTCDTTLIRRAPWRLSADACARAFDADYSNAALALAVAQAEHARGHLPAAAQWAKRALALDPKAAEAYVLIARAEVENGNDEDARAAYRHYLELAPRGWHKAEARAATNR